jgi:hypothetical protein
MMDYTEAIIRAMRPGSEDGSYADELREWLEWDDLRAIIVAGAFHHAERWTGNGLASAIVREIKRAERDTDKR